MKEELLAQILEALLAIRGLVVQKTKLIGDCGRLLRELLDSLLQESYENKRHFIRACVSGLSRDRNGRSPVVSALLVRPTSIDFLLLLLVISEFLPHRSSS